MKNEFVATVILFNVQLFVTVAVPSGILFKSVERYLSVYLVLAGLCDIFAARALVWWKNPFESMTAPWSGTSGNKVHQFLIVCFFSFIISVVFTILQAFLYVSPTT